MLDAAGPGSLPAAIVLGRTLATPSTAATASPAPSYFAGQVENNQVTITYTVYNEQADTETGVLLTTTLAPGVNVISSSVTLDGVTTPQLPDQSGRNLAWSLRPIPGYSRESVSLTVSLPGPSSLGLDLGSQVFAVLNAGAVTDTAPAAALKPGNVADPAFLASTPDANTTDPFIQEQAAKLDYDPDEILDFLHTEIGYNSYLGSVRGARGALWSSAGNALDVASLGVALMRASGVPARYVAGSLSHQQAQSLILSMFPAGYQTVGLIPPGTPVSNPADDPALQSETQSHYWLQFDTGGGMQDADPLMPGAAIGQTFTTASGTFAEVVQSLRATTKISLDAEIYSQAGALFGAGSGLSTTTVLDQTFNDVDLVGRPLSIGNLVTQTGAGAIFTAITNNYSPYIVIGDEALADSQLPDAITGRQYQEILTNFPLGSQILTGLFLNITSSNPAAGDPPQTISRALVDRIGYAARQGLAAPENLSVNASGAPIISPFDLTTINVLPGLQSPQAAALAQARAIAALTVANAQSPPDVRIATNALLAMGRAEVANIAAASDTETANLAHAYGVAAYFAAPRITMFSSNVVTTGSQSTLTFEFDLARDSIRAVVGPGQATQAGLAFAAVRGVFDSYLEANSLPVSSGGVNMSSASIVAQSIQQDIPLVTIGPDQLSLLQSLNLPADAQAYITTALQNGFVVLAPSRAIMVDGRQVTAWYVGNPETGEVYSQGQNGRNQGMYEYPALITNIIFNVAINIALTEMLPGPHPPIEIGKAGAFGAIGALFPFSFLGFLGSLALTYLTSPIGILQDIDPPTPGLLVDMGIPYPTTPGSTAQSSVLESRNQAPGAVTGSIRSSSISVTGTLAASWRSRAQSSFLATALNATASSVRNSSGANLGSGALALSSPTPLALSISGDVSYAVNGVGNLTFHGPAESTLGVSGNWQSDTATMTGNVSMTLTVPAGALSLGGTALPAGTYTVTTSSAALTGGGATASSTFSDSISLSASNATLEIGPGSGSLSIAGHSLSAGNETTFEGFTGALNITANGDPADAVSLNGTAANVLQVSTTPSAPTTDQNTSITFGTGLVNSLADTYNLTANAPPGWTVRLDSLGNVTATPAPGLQGGTYPIRIIAQSETNPNLIAQTTASVTVNPTQPGMKLTVPSDPLLTVPFNGAQLPTAFQATIQNLGPAADTYNLTYSNVPGGFALLSSATSVTVPAARTGLVGLYLQPDPGQPPPAPGTVLMFDVTATSTTTPSIARTQTVSVTVPAIDALTITASPASVNTTPGADATATITITNAGNVPEGNVTFDVTPSAGLMVSGLTPLSLDVGQSVTRTITLTPSASTPLNSSLTASIVAGFGPSSAPATQTLTIPVRVVVPGADAIADAADAAVQLGNAGLGARLTDLSTALTSLVGSPGDPVARSQALAALDSVIGQLGSDATYALIVTRLQTARASLESAAGAAGVRAAVSDLGTVLDDLGSLMTHLADHKFTLSFLSNNLTAQPGSPATFAVLLQNTGTEATTIDLALEDLSPGLTGDLSQQTVALAPGEANTSIYVTITPSASVDFSSLGFVLRGTAQEAPDVTAAVQGTLAARREFVSVVSVAADPPFTEPGALVNVSARVLNAVNRVRTARASFSIVSPSSQTLFTSPSVNVGLGIQTSVTTVDLGAFDTSGLPDGTYTIQVNLVSDSGDPIPGGTGAGSLLIGSPVSASLALDQDSLPPGTGVVTDTLTVEARTSLIGPLGVVSQTDLPGASAVTRNGQYVYASGSSSIGVYDVADPAAPQHVRDFGFSATLLQVHGDKLYALTRGGLTSPFYLRIYSLSDPSNPQFLGSAKYTDGTEGIPYYNAWHMVVTDTDVYVTIWGFTYLIGSNDIKYQTGDLIAIDVTDPAAPVFESALLNTYGTNNDGIGRFLNVDMTGGDGPLWEIAQLDQNTLLVAGSTVKGDDTEDGSGVVHVLDVSDPAHMRIVNTLAIPNTVQVVGLSIDGDRAFVTGSTTGWEDRGSLDFTGDTVLAVLDVSDPQNPALLGEETLNRSSRGPADQFTAALDGGLFAFSSRYNPTSTENPALFVVDASDPLNLSFESTDIPAFTSALYGDDTYIYTTSASGLIIYQLRASDAIPATVRVDVPNNQGVSIIPGSFSVAPSQIIPGAGFDTFVFDLSLTGAAPAETITWQTKVTDLAAGESRQVVTGATVDFTSQGANGQVVLGPLTVAGEHVLGLDPDTQTASPGESVPFTLSLTNPTAASLTYALTLQGLPGTWSDLPASVTLPAGTQQFLPFTLTSNVSTPVGNLGFSIVATAQGLTDSVGGNLNLAGEPAGPDSAAHGVVAVLTPNSSTAGQGTSAVYSIRVFNTGSALETYSLEAAPPQGVAARLSQTTVTVPPGASNFRDVQLTLTVAAGTPPGSVPFSVTAASTADPGVSSTADGTLSVLNRGVTLTLNPYSANPGATYQLTVTNTGAAPDTFDLALGGPAALVSTLGRSTVSLAPGASLAVPINTSAVNFALAGSLGLTAIAESQADPTVRQGAFGSLAIPTRSGMTAEFTPAAQTLAAPGTATFSLQVHNTGNAEDQYSATIVGTSGPVTASLTGLDGKPTQSIPLFHLPGLAATVIPLLANVSAAGPATVAVLLKSLTTGQETIVVASVSTGVAAADGPRVTSVRRYGIHLHPTTVVLNFDQPLDPVRAANVQEYRLVDPRGRVIRIRSAVYDPNTYTVTLYPRTRLNLHWTYHLTVRGASPSGLTSTSGMPLNGKANGQPGSDYVTRLTWRNLFVPGRRNYLKLTALPAREKAVKPIRHNVRRTIIAGHAPFRGPVAFPGRVAAKYPVAERPKSLLARPLSRRIPLHALDL